MTPAGFDRLFVLWRDPTDDGAHHVVGFLERRDPRFHFRYAPNTDAAIAAGFAPFVGFPRMTEAVESGYLFPMFAQRIPSPARPDYARLMDQWGIVHRDDPMEVLARSGGVQLTDRVELAEWRAKDDDLSRPLELRLAGIRHHPSAHVEVGAEVTLRAEPANEADPHAVAVLDAAGARIGYVPRQYAEMLSRVIGAGDAVRASVVRKVPDPDCACGRCVIRVSR